MSLKSYKNTARRIVKMVESGDYDIEIVEHMLESLIKGRSRRIKKLETKAKPRNFDMTEKRISAALKETIKSHGPITSNYIGSAAKRIYGICQQVENIVPPVEDTVTRLQNGNIVIVREKNTTHKLTVARDGNIRIKIAIGTTNEDANYIIEKFIVIAINALNLKKGTLRGKLDPKKDMTSITLVNDSKTEKFNFKL